MHKILFRVVLPAALVGVAVACAGAMVALRPAAARVEAAQVATPVEVVRVRAEARRAVVQATGTVNAAQRVTVVPEVSGRITWVADALIPGGRFREGELLARIDDRDYALAVRAEESRVRQAELELQLEEGRHKVARREWALLGAGQGDGEASPLALRQPQLDTARAAVEAARSGLERARLALERTRLAAPFDAMVVSESADVGQVVGPGNPVAVLVGTRRFLVQVSVSVQDLRSLDPTGGDEAVVVQRLGDGGRIERRGRVLQLGGELDPQTRTATVQVEIPEPLGGDGLPLLPGAFVDVAIHGREIPGVFEIPRRALRDEVEVLVASPEDRLERREVQLLWGDDDTVAVRGDLSDGDRVIVTAIATPIEGMPVRVLDPPPSEAP